MTHTAENPLGAQRVRTFSNTNSLNMHEIIHTGERTFKGISCDKNFSTSCMLRRHEMAHTMKKQMMFQKCFAKAIELGTHKRTHTGEKSFKYKTWVMSFSSQVT